MCLEVPPWFVSIFGGPAAGKSYFLAAMTHVLRRQLPATFRVSFTDTDADANQTICGYEQPLFQSATPDDLLALGELIAKTQEQGDLYDTVQFGANVVQFPRPFLFTLRPQGGHPLAADPGPVSRVLCLYDNAGESFLAGRDSSVRPVTRHLAESSLLLFLFDPTQHQPFRQRVTASRAEVASDIRAGQGLQRQHLILTEAASRVRRFAGLPDTAKHDRPLVVIVTKQDVWGHLVPELQSTDPVTGTGRSGGVLNLDRVDEQSRAIRRLLAELTPEVVDAAEQFARSVTYVGVSALGAAPVRDGSTDRWAVRPRDVRPVGVEVPILYGLNRLLPRLFPGGRKKPATATTDWLNENTSGARN
jgi:hypothetical protein